MSSPASFVVVKHISELVKNTVETLVTTPVTRLDRKWFLGCLTQGSSVTNTMDQVVVALAKSKKTTDHRNIAARMQTLINGVPALEKYKVEARMEEVWDQQQAAYEALTPEELAAYNALSPEELAEHSF